MGKSRRPAPAGESAAGQAEPGTCASPDRTSAMPPQALGDDMDVPFMSWVPRSVQLGTEAMAPPGALTLTPRAPSALEENKAESA